MTLTTAALLIIAASFEAQFDIWAGLQQPERIAVATWDDGSTAPAPAAARRVSVHFSPVALASTSIVLGKGREIGLWNIRVCNETREGLAIATGRLLNAAPRVRFLTAGQTMAIIDEMQRRRPRSKLLALARFASSGGSLAALAKQANGLAAGLGAASAALGFLGDYLEGQLPNTAAITAELMPEAIALAGAECGTWTKAASLGPGAREVGPVFVEVP